MVNPKAGVTKKQSTTNFPKNKHFFPPNTHTHHTHTHTHTHTDTHTHTHTCVSGGKERSFFWKVRRALFSCNTRF